MIKYPRGRFFLKSTLLLRKLPSLLFGQLDSVEENSRLQTHFRRMYDYNHVVMFSSCRMALHELLVAMRLKDSRNEILLGPITIPDIINAISTADFKPVLVDLAMDTHVADLNDLCAKYTPNTRAILITLLSGLSVNWGPIVNFCRTKNICLIVDASQGHSVPLLGADYVMFSLSIGKELSSLVGGVLLLNDDKLYSQIKSNISQYTSPPKRTLFYKWFRNLFFNLLTTPVFFSYTTYYMIKIKMFFYRQTVSDIFSYVPQGRTYRSDIFFDDIPIKRSKMPEAFKFYFSRWQADLVLGMTGYYQDLIAKRKKNVELFYSHCGPSVKKALSVGNHINDSSFYHLPILLEKNKDKVQMDLFLNGFDTGSYGLNLCSEEKSFPELNRALPNAKKIKYQTFFLPIWEYSTEESMLRLAKILNFWLDE